MLARNSYGLGWRSNTLSFTTVSVPPTPTNSSYDTRSVTLEWDAYAGTGIGAVTNYSVTLCTTPYADITKSIACEGESRVQYAGDALTTTVGGLTPGETYAFTVQGFTTAWSGPSNPLTITTRPDVPDAPPAPTAGALLRTRSVGLVWAAPTADNGEPFTAITVKQSPASADGTASYPLGADARALPVVGEFALPRDLAPVPVHLEDHVARDDRVEVGIKIGRSKLKTGVVSAVSKKGTMKLRNYGRYSAVVKAIKCNATIGNSWARGSEKKIRSQTESSAKEHHYSQCL